MGIFLKTILILISLSLSSPLVKGDNYTSLHHQVAIWVQLSKILNHLDSRVISDMKKP